MGLSLASSVGLLGHNVLVESIFVGFQLHIPRKQIRIEAEIFSFFFIGKFMDRVTGALDEIKKRKEKSTRSTNISSTVHGWNKL